MKKRDTRVEQESREVTKDDWRVGHLQIQSSWKFLAQVAKRIVNLIMDHSALRKHTIIHRQNHFVGLLHVSTQLYFPLNHMTGLDVIET